MAGVRPVGGPAKPRRSTARVLIDRAALATQVARLGAEVSAAYPEGLVMVGLLKGSVCFLADLLRATTVGCEVDFLAISAYAHGSGGVRLVKDLDTDISARDVLVVDDLVDTGLTLAYVMGELHRRDPRSVEACVLLDRVTRRLVPVTMRFVGFSVPDELVLGYGLDFAERYRNLTDVVTGDLGTLQADPDAHVKQLFSG